MKKIFHRSHYLTEHGLINLRTIWCEHVLLAIRSPNLVYIEAKFEVFHAVKEKKNLVRCVFRLNVLYTNQNFFTRDCVNSCRQIAAFLEENITHSSSIVNGRHFKDCSIVLLAGRNEIKTTS